MPKSVTVKIGADTKEFLNGLKGVDQEIKSTQKSATTLEKSLEYKYDTAVAQQAMSQLQKSIELSEQKAQSLREKMRELEASGRVDTADYSTLTLELAKAETSAGKAAEELERLKNIKVEQLNEKIDKVGSSIEKAGQKLSVLSAGAAGLIAGAAAITKSAATTGAEIDDMTQRFDISAETIQRWNYLALQSGVDTEYLAKALVKARATMADLSAGTSNTATQTLEKLGISAKQFGSDEEMFDGILQALAKVEDSTLQTAYANEIFGDRIATQLLPYINAGAEDLAKWNAEFDAMPSLTGEEAAALAELDDTFNRLNLTMQYASAQLGEAFAPLMERIVVFIEDNVVPVIEKLAEWFENLSPGMQNTILAMLGIIAVAGPLLILIGKMAPGLKVLTNLFLNMNKAQLLVVAGYAAMAGAAALAFNMISNWANMSWVEKVLSGLAIAALVAAAAVTVFHASWSLGIAVGAIAAGVVAGIAAIKAAADDIMPENNVDFSTEGIENYASGVTNGGYSLPEDVSTGSGTSYGDTTYADQYNVTVNVTQPGASAEEIAAAVGREIATIAQARR